MARRPAKIIRKLSTIDHGNGFFSLATVDVDVALMVTLQRFFETLMNSLPKAFPALLRVAPTLLQCPLPS
jgi:hypothetical protein